MKKLITTLLFVSPIFAFSQTPTKDTLINKTKIIVKQLQVVNSNEQELDDEYKERPFQGKEERLIVTPYTGMTDHEEYNAKLKNKKANPK
jgi:hypothetical protein